MVLGVLPAVAYAWWATGVPPFGARAYVAVGIPVVLVGALALGWHRPRPRLVTASGVDPPTVDTAPRCGTGSIGRGSDPPSAAPWLLPLAVAVAVEAVALALGGRSSTVPTLSTVVDHALGQHPVRFLLFCAWLGIGAAPEVRAQLRAARRAA